MSTIRACETIDGKFIIVDKNDNVDPCFGLDKFSITKKDIEALLAGKKLYATVSYYEYAITIELIESEA